MFSLVITIVSILVVGVLAVATIYFGGSAFTDGQSKASTATVVAEGQQIGAALQMHKMSTGSMPTGTTQEIKDALVAGQFLSAFPSSVDWNFVDGFAVATNLSEDQCLAYNKAHSVDHIPNCSDTEALSGSVCCNQ